MILVNVLLFVAIAAGVVALMIAAGEGSLDGATRMREAARALAVAEGGEASAITALRRDAIVAPGADHAGEPWGQIDARDVAIAGGRFDLAIGDATGRLNVNALADGDPQTLAVFGRVAEGAGVPQAEVAAAAALIRRFGPVPDLALLRTTAAPGAPALDAMLTALPVAAPVNLNAVTEPLLAILLADPMAAHRLIEQRARAGFLTAADFTAQGLTPPAGAGFTSDLYWVRVKVTIGGTTQQVTSLLARRHGADGTVAVVPVQRWIGAESPASR